MSIPSAFEDAFELVKGLVDDFKSKESYYLKSDYQEAQVRKDFLDKFFIALGWDVNHDEQKNPYEQEVKVEPPVSVEGRNKRADYSFAISPNFREPKFYAEAKKPFGGLKNAQNYFQTIRYAWNRSTPLAILTNFQEFHVLDCRYKPNIDNSIDRGIDGLSFFYTDFLNEEKFKRIYYLFSREAVTAGAIERLADELRPPRGKAYQKGLFKGGYQKIDDTILEELDEYRLVLAKAFKRTNPKLEGSALTEAVQRTIDRLVFIRFLEDKLIEEKDHVSNFGDSGSAWKDFVKTCRHLDPKYNGLIFHEHFIDRSEFHVPDDDEFGDICEKLAHVNSPYDFNAIPIDILGSMYERFLGKVIHTTDKQVRVEEKPQVKKAGGVFYTPQYIVRNIIENTVGAKIEGKNPARIASMRFADISCGSGSFVLGVYDYLINYHVQYYQKFPKESKNGDFENHSGKIVLSTRKKREILINNIFGVDIDPQAVEVTQLSLYLKMLEDETTESASQTRLEFKEAILPSLNNNIKCGNSLIGADYFAGQLIPDQAEMRRVNPFDWETEFAPVLKQGGFDCIVGNPPYIRIQMMKEWAPLEVEIYKEKYESAGSGNYDIYVVFVEKGLSLLNDSGLLGFILPHKFFNAQYGKCLRELVSKGSYLSKVVHFGDNQVFDGASTYTCLLFLDKGGKTECRIERVKDLLSWRETNASETGNIPSKEITSADWNFVVGESSGLFEKLKTIPLKLENVTDRIFQGVKTSADKIYIVEMREHKDKTVKVFSPEKGTEYWLEKDLLHPLIKGGDSKAFRLTKTDRFILFPYEKGELVSVDKLKKKYPLTWQYFLENKKYLDNREEGRFKGEAWYQFGRSQALDVMPLPKIFTPDLAMQSSYSLDETGECFFTGGAAGGYGILVLPEYSREYVLGLLNSKLLDWYLRQTTTPLRGGWYSFESRFIKNLPIHKINEKDKAERDLMDALVKQVKQAIAYNERLVNAQSDTDSRLYQRQIDSATRELNDIVYRLYGLTKEEIKLVDGQAE